MDINVVLVSLGVCVLLPVLIVWCVMRFMTNRTNKRAEIVMSAIEKNPDLDVEALMKTLAPAKKSQKEKLVSLLQRGCIFSFIGLAFLGLTIWTYFFAQSLQAMAPFGFFFVSCTGIGISNLIAYNIQKKNLSDDNV